MLNEQILPIHENESNPRYFHQPTVRQEQKFVISPAKQNGSRGK